MDEEISLSRQERRMRDRQAQIIKAAAQLFAEKGYHRTTTRDIAAAVDLSEGALYKYFDSKNDLLFGIMNTLVEAQALESRLVESIAIDARMFFEELMHQRHESIAQLGEMQQALLSEILANTALRERYRDEILQPYLARVEAHLQKRVDLGEIHPVDPAAGARLIFSLLLGLFVLQVLGDTLVNDDWPLITTTAVQLLFDGLARHPS